MKQTILNKYWEILNLSEDYFCHGYKKQHPPAPAYRERIEPSVKSDKSNGDIKNPEELFRKIKSCRKCDLHLKRHQAVPGEGASPCQVLVVGDIPSLTDDGTGHPFDGEEGAYLDKWLEAINLSRNENVFLCFANACRPQGGKQASDEQKEACFPYLTQRLQLFSPQAILCLGQVPDPWLPTGYENSCEKLRGTLHSISGIPLVVTYPPRDVLADSTLRRAVWGDLKLLRSSLES